MKAIIKSNPLLPLTLTSIIADKVEDPILMDLRSFKTILDDVLIICTCKSEAQMRTVLNHLKKSLSKAGEKQIYMDYSPGDKWGILSCSAYVIHLFEKKTREYYSLEKLWGEDYVFEINPDDYIKEIKKTEDEHEFI